MRTRFLTAFVLLFSISFVFQNCSSDTSNDSTSKEIKSDEVSSEKVTQHQIIPPLDKIDVPFHSFKVNVNKAQTLHLDNGTSIEIPEKAFVDASGNPITTPVQIAYREFHNASEILASGIPMKATHNDLEGNMQTAGMFEIDAASGESKVFLANGKEIKVNMASHVDGDNYDFWQLEKENGTWKNEGTSSPIANSKKQEAKKELAKLNRIKTPVKPVQFDKTKTVLNFDLNLDGFPSLKNMKNIFWQYTGKGNDPNQDKWIFKEKWETADIKLNRNNEYTLILKNANKNFSTTVCPSQTGKEFDAAMASYENEMKAYKSTALSISDKKAFMDRQADFLRSVKVNQLGIYNYDILLKSPENLLFAANFDFGKEVPKSHSKVNVYLITNDARSVVAFPYADRKRFGIDPNVDNKLVAILPNNKIATFSQKDFDANFDEMSAANGKAYTFKMKVKTESISGVDDLSKAIAAL